MTHTANQRRQRGAVIITMALLLLFLLGFMGFALDFGRLFIVKTELQTAMDSCALSAAQELDGLANAITRARSAGATAANLNRVNLQSVSWDGKGQVLGSQLNFFDGTFTPTTSDATAKYVECTHVQPDVRLWLIRAMAAFSGNYDTFPATQDVAARAIAKRGSAQSTCPIPVGVKVDASATPPMYGFVRGQWVVVWGSRTPNSGEFGWYSLDPDQNGTNALNQQLESTVCNTRVGDILGTPGARTAVDDTWNYRFGIYRNQNVDRSLHRPDYSGYSYRPRVATAQDPPGTPPGNWTSSRTITLADGTTTNYCCAWDSAPSTTASDATAQPFTTKRANYANYADTGTTVFAGSRIVYGAQRNNQDPMNSFNAVATSGANGDHARYGVSDRRIAAVPVMNLQSRVIDYLCVFMLHPMSGPQDNARVEIVGPASDPSSPCTTSGIPGGTVGPLVPVLVR